MNWRVHAITFLVFVLAFGSLKLVWDNPRIILYLVLGLVVLLGYGALYLIVKAKLDQPAKK